MVDTKYKTFKLKNINTKDFLMTPLELSDYIDFEPKRVYLISTPHGDYKTGQHSHIEDEDELFVAVQGQCKIILDEGRGIVEEELVAPGSAIYVPHTVWHGFKDLSEDCIILAISSTNYDPERKDYLEDYEEFKDRYHK